MTSMGRAVTGMLAICVCLAISGFSCDSPKSKHPTKDEGSKADSRDPLEVTISHVPSVRKVTGGAILPADLVPVKVKIVNRTAVNMVFSTDPHHLRLVLYRNGVIVSDPILQNSWSEPDLTKGLICLPKGASTTLHVPDTGISEKISALDSKFTVVVQLLGVSTKDLRADEARKLKAWAKKKRGTLYQRPRFESKKRELSF
jgi:hypothetical protein